MKILTHSSGRSRNHNGTNHFKTKQHLKNSTKKHKPATYTYVFLRRLMQNNLNKCSQHLLFFISPGDSLMQETTGISLHLRSRLLPLVKVIFWIICAISIALLIGKMWKNGFYNMQSPNLHPHNFSPIYGRFCLRKAHSIVTIQQEQQFTPNVTIQRYAKILV